MGDESEIPKTEDAATTRRAIRIRLAFVTVILYVAIIVVGLATLIAYPEFFNNSDYRTRVIRDNYQGLVSAAAAISGLITIAIVSPRVLTSLSDIFLPSRALKDAIEGLVFSIAGIKVPASDQGKNVNAPEGNEVGASDEPELRPAVVPKVEDISADDIVANFIVRMRDEQKRLKGNALSNLVWGVMFAIFGLAVLSYPVLFPASIQPSDWVAFTIGYLPRAALATMIALISFFFLRLYASNEYDLKHTKNEISTFESKMISAKIALSTSSADLLGQILWRLADNERNFVLKSGEKTISTEVDTKYNDILVVLRDLAAAVQKSESKS